jgi:hypothetical protein
LTAIFHPNVSFSGFINLKDIGLTWESDLGLDVLCERLWDVARAAYLDLEGATNSAARSWFAAQKEIELPVDDRPLRDLDAPGGTNVLRARRGGEGPLELPHGQAGDVLFIGEDTPTPEIPVRLAPPRRLPRGDDDVLYIGDE